MNQKRRGDSCYDKSFSDSHVEQEIQIVVSRIGIPDLAPRVPHKASTKRGGGIVNTVESEKGEGFLL